MSTGVPVSQTHSLAAISPSEILTLQRSAGNRAVRAQLAAHPVVQIQRLRVSSADLAPHVTKESKTNRRFGGSTFGKISRLLAAYESAGTDPAERENLLAKLDLLGTEWINTHPSGTGQNDARRPFIEKLLNEIPAERAALSKQQAQAVYVDNLRAKKGTDGALGALSTTAKMGTKTPSKKSSGPWLSQAAKLDEQMKATGLSEAEIMSILVYSATDYKYINPIVANSRSWTRTQKGTEGMEGMTALADNEGTDQKTGDALALDLPEGKGGPNVAHDKATAMSGSARQVVEEGALHAGIVMEALKKLTPYKGKTYRGERITRDQFKKKYAKGTTFSFAAFASTSFDKSVSANFAHGLSGDNVPTASQDVSVLQVLTNAGGRDISALSMVPEEKEVLLLPGSSFVVKAIAEINGESEYSDQVRKLKEQGFPLPKYWYLVQLVPVPAGRRAPDKL